MCLSTVHSYIASDQVSLVVDSVAHRTLSIDDRRRDEPRQVYIPVSQAYHQGLSVPHRAAIVRRKTARNGRGRQPYLNDACRRPWGSQSSYGRVKYSCPLRYLRILKSHIVVTATAQDYSTFTLAAAAQPFIAKRTQTGLSGRAKDEVGISRKVRHHRYSEANRYGGFGRGE